MNYPTRDYLIGPNERDAQVFTAESMWEAFRDAREAFPKKSLFYYGPSVTK